MMNVGKFELSKIISRHLRRRGAPDASAPGCAAPLAPPGRDGPDGAILGNSCGIVGSVLAHNTTQLRFDSCNG